MGRGLYSFLSCQIHTDEDEEAADEEEDGDALGEDEPGKEDGDDGIEIDVVRGDDSSELADYPVPNQKTDHRCHAAKEEEIAYYIWTQKDAELGV